LVSLGNAERVQLTTAIVWAAWAAALSTIAQTWGALPQAVQRTVATGVVGSISMVVWLIATLWGLSARLGVIALGIGLFARALFLTAGFLVVILMQWREMRLPSPMYSNRVIVDLVVRSAPVFLSRIGTAVVGNAQPAITALVISPTAAAILAISSRLADVVRMVLSQIGSAVFASLSHIHVTDRQRTPDVLKTLFFASNVLLAIGLGAIMAFNRSLVTVWVGVDKYGGDILTLLIVISTAMSVIMSLNMNFLQSLGCFRASSFIDIGEAPLRLMLMIGLGKTMGIKGLVLASLIGTLALKGWAYPKLLAEALQINIRRAAVIVGAGTIHFVLSMGLAIIWLVASPAAASWPQLAAQVGVFCFLISGLILVVSRGARGFATIVTAPVINRVRKALTR
jgi:O-antigen/teichoic acid export membrane protein